MGGGVTSFLLPFNFKVGANERKFKIPLKHHLSVTVSLSPEHVYGEVKPELAFGCLT